MATLSELNGLLNDPILSEKVGGACIKAAVDVKNEDAGTANHANRLKWAKKIFSDTQGERVKVMRYVIAANAGLTLAQINALSDTDIQNHVNASIDVFADGS